MLLNSPSAHSLASLPETASFEEDMKGYTYASTVGQQSPAIEDDLEDYTYATTECHQSLARAQSAPVTAVTGRCEDHFMPAPPPILLRHCHVSPHHPPLTTEKIHPITLRAVPLLSRFTTTPSSIHTTFERHNSFSIRSGLIRNFFLILPPSDAAFRRDTISATAEIQFSALFKNT